MKAQSARPMPDKAGHKFKKAGVMIRRGCRFNQGRQPDFLRGFMINVSLTRKEFDLVNELISVVASKVSGLNGPNTGSRVELVLNPNIPQQIELQELTRKLRTVQMVQAVQPAGGHV